MVTGDLTSDLIERPIWTDAMVADAGIPIIDAPFVTVGGGLGSFVLVDFLRMAGVPTSDIRVLTGLDKPHETYQHLVRVSQIPDYERLRSDSGSCLDNIWAFPSYAVREAFAAKDLKGLLWPLWNVFSEPVLANYYTPRAGFAYSTVEREMPRIAWQAMLAKGQVRMTRKRLDSGYFTILTPPEGTFDTRRIAYRSRFVHLAVGYPGVRYLADLQAYADKYNDPAHLVNAYGQHEYVYDQLIRRPGVVVVRGSGIVASRILQRLIEDRDKHGAKTQIWHLFRTYYSKSEGPPWFHRRAGDGWQYQGFNWPKSAWGGQHRKHLEKLEGEERRMFLDSTGGTTTPVRNDWQEQLRRGRSEGFYRVHIGEVDAVMPGPDDTVITRIRSADGLNVDVAANFIIDATGLEGDIRVHRLMADLLDHTGAGLNPLRRLDVSRDFEVRGTANGNGKIYASGSMTLGGYYSPVDSFLGLQFAALRIADDLARQGLGRRVGVGRSIANWWSWLRNRPI